MTVMVGHVATEVGVECSQTDPRGQVIERIASSATLQRSARLRQLFLYLAERGLRGDDGELTEQQIGRAVFGKSANYSPVEDSSVRVHARQLRLKLHEYFDSEGRGEPIVVEIPKGSYKLVFRQIEPAKPQSPTATPLVRAESVIAADSGAQVRPMLPWVLVAVLAVAVVILWISRNPRSSSVEGPSIPWPVSEIIKLGQTTSIVLADANYGMMRIMSGHAGSLDDYLSSDLSRHFLTHEWLRDPITSYISNSLLTSWADVSVATSLVKLAGPQSSRVIIRSARDLRPRDLEQGNYVFLGSPGSNPWVSLFEDRLNFHETEAAVGRSVKAFRNAQPLPGEKERYEGLAWTGTSGEDYATVSLFPNNAHSGNIMILQGLQQEGTEAAGMLLSESTNRAKLLQALHVSAGAPKPAAFDVLIKTTALAGAPAKITVVATRLTR